MRVTHVDAEMNERSEGVPQSFNIGQRRVAVVEVLDRWIAPAERYYKVRGDDEGIYILRHDRGSACWELTLFDSGVRLETRLSST